MFHIKVLDRDQIYENTGWRRETGKFEVNVGSPVDVQ
jgi:hypothetical protein